MAAHVAESPLVRTTSSARRRALCRNSERAALVKRRLAAFRECHAVSEIPLAIVSGHADLRTSRESAEEIVKCAHKLTEIGEVPTSLIFIDTVSRALAGGDENHLRTWAR